jgi:hypothetical protein
VAGLFLWRKRTPKAALSALFRFGVVAARLYWPTGLRARRALALVLALLARDAGTRDRVKRLETNGAIVNAVAGREAGWYD